MIAYISSNRSPTVNPLPIGDQTLWELGTTTNGMFTGVSQATFATGSTVNPPTYAFMQGVVTKSGQIRITFTSPGGNPPVIGVGQMENINGVPLMEMQMITGTSPQITHWAYMTPTIRLLHAAVTQPIRDREYHLAAMELDGQHHVANHQSAHCSAPISPVPSRSRTTTTAITGAWAQRRFEARRQFHAPAR